MLSPETNPNKAEVLRRYPDAEAFQGNRGWYVFIDPELGHDPAPALVRLAKTEAEAWARAAKNVRGES